MKYNTPDDLKEQESKTMTETLKESPEIFWFNEFYIILQKILFLIPKKREKEELDVNPAIFFLLMWTTLKIVHTSNSIMNLIYRGYYHQGMILLRSIQEEFHHLLFFRFHPQNDIKQWAEGRYNFKTINKVVKKKKNIYVPKRWKEGLHESDIMYEMLSRYVHPSIESWTSILKIQKNSSDIHIKYLPIFEKNSFDTVYSGVIVYLGNTINLLIEKYETEIKEAGIREEIIEKLSFCEQEYMIPILKLMSLDDDGTPIIG